ncbi:DUF1330 domain-containing protein [Jannaschia seohaensis]|uniref:Uncharacterized conserved protein, DUF1330 family n=1 Tax=Jannaschia seohaensis TaxID=475081 RepID=A0A2Y9C5P3_9RHOB|nr:DUF1330 domain-containing protein [Jannaschia seohaensis]PWJ21263.1 uncharacterized protein (DUF1330 family) [Jannaschia seohaensis]SSA41673.1 Uncharacterized conserved protein, DUF1330 family [Jannaschia seohaensis]
MPKGYVVARIRVQDKDGFEEFKRLSGPVIAEYGGRVLVRDPAPDVREGAAEGLVIIVEFDDPGTARAFYESEGYTEAKRVREAVSQTELVLATGL